MAHNQLQHSRDGRDIERIAAEIVDAALSVHRALGPGLLERAYQTCFAYELRHRGIGVDEEVELPVRYRALLIEPGFRIDMLVEGCILVENKTVATLLPVHRAQLTTYLKLSAVSTGFLINWNVPLIRDGIRRLNGPARVEQHPAVP